MGSWVREAALEALAHTVPLVPESSSRTDAESPLSDVVPNTISACLQQAVERIARVREVRKVSQRTGPTAETLLAAGASESTHRHTAFLCCGWVEAEFHQMCSA